MKITKGELILLFNAMSVVKEKLKAVSITSTKVYYPIAKNISLIENEIKALKDIDPNILITEYDGERIILAEKYAKKDEQGEFIKVKNERGNTSYDIPDENIEELKSAIKSLWDSKYKDTYQDAVKQFNEIIAEDVVVKLNLINIEDLEKRLPELEVDVIDNLLKIIKN